MSAVAGPYWVRTATNGEHHVCGRNAVTIRKYMPHQIDMASADCRKLQAGYTKAEKAIRDAASELLAACRLALNFIENTEGEIGEKLNSGDALRAAITKATIA